MFGRLITALGAIMVFATGLPSTAAEQSLPNPDIELLNTEAYSTSDGKFIRYRY